MIIPRSSWKAPPHAIRAIKVARVAAWWDSFPEYSEAERNLHHPLWCLILHNLGGFSLLLPSHSNSSRSQASRPRKRRAFGAASLEGTTTRRTRIILLKSRHPSRRKSRVSV